MLEQHPNQHLTFHLLDNTLGLSVTEREKNVQNTRPFRLGPLVEYAFQDLPSAHLRLRQWVDTSPVSILSNALAKGTIGDFANSSSITPQHVEFFRIPLNDEQMEEPRWVTFVKRLEAASSKAGLFTTFAALAGTFGE